MVNKEDFDLLKERDKILNYIKNTMISSEKNAAGLRKMKERGFSQEGMLDKVIEVTAIQSEQIKTLATICHIYAQSFEFCTKLGEAMIAQYEEAEKKKENSTTDSSI